MRNIQNKRMGFVLLLAFFICPLFIFCQELNLNDSVPFNYTTKNNFLSNGFSYYLSCNTTKPGKIWIKFDIKAGIFQEEPDQTEVTHVLEHIVFRGSLHFPENKSLKEYLKSVGVTSYNAYPSNEFTTFYFEIPADTIVAKNIFLAFRDWLSGNAIVTNETIVAEKKIVTTEILQRGTVDYYGAACELLRPSRFSDTYATIASNNLSDKVIKLSSEAIRRFYKNWYRPNLAGLIVVGDIDVPIMERLVKQMFEYLQNPAVQTPHSNYPIVLTGKNKYIINTHPDAKDISLKLFFMKNLAPKKTYGDYKEAVLREISNKMLKNRLSDIHQSRLVQSVEKINGGIANGIYALNSLRLQSLNFSTRCENKKSIDAGLNSLFRESERIKRHGFNEAELKLAQSALLADLSENKESSTEESERYSNHFIYKEAAPNAELILQIQKKFLSRITLQEINQFARSWVSSKNSGIVIQCHENTKQFIPGEDKVLSLWKKVQQESLLPYVINNKKETEVNVNFDSLYKVPPAPSYIRKYNKEHNITQLELANGVKVILKPSVSASGDRIYLNGISPKGALSIADAKYFSAKMATQIRLESGLGELTKDEMKFYTQKHNIKTNSAIDDYESIVKANAPAREFEVLLQLLYRYFLNPNKDSAAYRSKMDELMQQANPDNYINKELTTLTGYPFQAHHIVDGLSVEELNKIDYEESLKGYKEVFSNPQEFMFVITGCQDLENTIVLATKYLSNLPSHNINPEQHRSIDSSASNFSTHKTIVNKNLKKDRAEVLVLYGGYHVYSSHERIKQHTLAKVVEAACFRRLREKEAGVYSLFASMHTRKISADNTPSWYELKIYFVCNPAVSAKLIKAAEEEIEILKTNGPTLNDFNAAIQEYKKELLLSNLSDAQWSYEILKILRNKEDFSVLSDLDVFINSIQPEDIQKAAQEYINKDHFFSYTQIPLSK